MNIDISNPGPLPDFLGIPWGASQDEARAAMAYREGVVLVEQMSGAQNLAFAGGLFANKDVALWVLQFGSGGMHTAKVNIRPPKAVLADEFDDLIARLTREYGSPSERSGPGQVIYTFGGDGELEGSILCQQTPEGQIVIAYQHQGLNVAAMGGMRGLDAPVGTPSQDGQGGGCFIATAAYGSDCHPDVLALRAFRDRALLPSPVGRGFVSAYYKLSPPVARLIAQRPRARAAVRAALVRPLATLVKNAGAR